MKNKYSYIVGDTFINVINTETGESSVITSENPRFKEALDAVKTKDFVDFELRFNKKAAVKSFVKGTEVSEGDFKVFLDSGYVSYSYKNGPKTGLNNAITDRIISMAENGFSVEPLCKFMANLLSNPSKTAINELYLFLEACKLPITEDGYFIAYKIVRGDYLDIYTGTVRNAIGDVPEMPRFEVDDNRNNTCSRGLHFCSKEYLSEYGSGKKNTDRVMLVKINPADVVSIPSDYNNAKGRAWRYEVVGEVPDGWRDTLPKQDYTADPVVDSKGESIFYSIDSVDEDNFASQFTFNHTTKRWHRDYNNQMVSRMTVANESGLAMTEILYLEGK